MTTRNSYLFLVLIPVAFLAAEDQHWKDKPVAQWTEREAKEILSDSPWVKQVSPTVAARSSNERQRSRGGMGSNGAGGGGIRIGGMGIPGMGGPRMGGRGGGMGRPPSQTDPGTNGSAGSAPTLTVRWESALPVQAAHLKLADANGPSIDEGYYIVAVSNLPQRLVGGDVKDLEKRVKSQGELRREGKKTIRSSDAKVLAEDDGLRILFKFPRSADITRDDRVVEFAARIGDVKLAQSFKLDEMAFEGKLEL
jgi:hypothetical protein